MISEENPTATGSAPISMPSRASSTLQSKNIRIHKHRTSVRLEPEMWDALNEIARLEGCSIHDLCGAVHDLKDPAASFTAALRVFMMEYYRSASKASDHIQQVQKQVKIAQEEKRAAKAGGSSYLLKSF